MYLGIKIEQQVKKYQDNIHNENIRINLLQAIPFWIASMLTGLLAFGYAKLFTWTLAAMVAGIASLIIDKHSFFDHLKRKFIEESAAEMPPTSITPVVL